MKFVLLFISVLISQNFAVAAASERLVCTSADQQTLVLVEELQEPEVIEGSINAVALMVLVKVEGQNSGDRIPLAGSKEFSAKGPYYDLTGPDGYALFIAAAASKSYSEVTVDRKKINVSCE